MIQPAMILTSILSSPITDMNQEINHNQNADRLEHTQSIAEIERRYHELAYFRITPNAMNMLTRVSQARDFPLEEMNTEMRKSVVIYARCQSQMETRLATRRADVIREFFHCLMAELELGYLQDYLHILFEKAEKLTTNNQLPEKDYLKCANQTKDTLLLVKTINMAMNDGWNISIKDQHVEICRY